MSLANALPVKLLIRWTVWLLLGVLLVFCVRITIEIVAPRAILSGAEGQKGLKTSIPEPYSKALIERGRYLAILGNCAACHTERGGAPFAGGKAIHTPFGAVFASNITPDPQHGIGRWSADGFYRALTEGISASGTLLTPAFPYPNYSRVTREDSDALFAYFMQGVQPQSVPNKAHELQFPFNTQLALAVWRVLFFSEDEPQNTINSIAKKQDSMPGTGQKDSKVLVERGRYLIEGLGHCSACHGQRNALGAGATNQFAGALMPQQDWYAPSLHAREEAGVQHWPREQVMQLLSSGVTNQASALGPMAEVVAKSTQFWKPEDLEAAAAYLQSLPVSAAPSTQLPTSRATESTAQQLRSQGAALYAQHCATCHGEQGQGLQVEGKVARPALAGNRAVTLPSSANLVRIMLAGGYAPATPGNPRPYGMPPFVHVLGDEDIAALTTFIRSSWGNQASAVTASQVVAQRRGVLQ
jgi:mono/diheme cytochrome c family protein